MSAKSAPAGSPDDVIVGPAAGKAAVSEAQARQAMLALSQILAHAPESAVQALVESAMKLTGAGSAGVSLEDTEGGEPVFRWIAAAGEFARYLHGTLPRHFSPCGEVVDRGRTLVMREPARYYDYIGELHAPVSTVLLAPFARRGKLVGTLWVVAHAPGEGFTDEDARIVQDLTTFVTAILDAIQARQHEAGRAPAK